CYALAVDLLLLAAIHVNGNDEFATTLPDSVKAVWIADDAYREATTTSERICINGLWRWQPVMDAAANVPSKGWGYFKVPGCWPGITDYMQKDSQSVFLHPSWKDQRLGSITSAWHEREIIIPSHWTDRRIALSVEYLNSYVE